MQIQELYRCEGFFCDINCLEGRWNFRFNSDEVLFEEAFQPKIEWTDFLGNHEKAIFNFNKPENVKDIFHVLPLTPRLVLLECSDILPKELRDYMEPPIKWWILELDWESKTCKIGRQNFTCELLDSFAPRAGHPQIDRSYSESTNEDIYFLIYKQEDNRLNCLHCKIDVRKLKFEQLGSGFELPAELFNCIDLNGNTISGLSTSLDAISRFDLNTRQLSPSSQQVQGLPPSICLTPDGFSYVPAAGVWTSTHLYLWSEDKHDNEKAWSSFIYFVELKTGLAQKVSHTFNGQIRQLFINANGHLIIRLDTFLRRELYDGGPALSAHLDRRDFGEFRLLGLKH